MDFPGTGVGKTGLWLVGVEVSEVEPEEDFALEATAALGFVGVVSGTNVVGSFGLESEGILGFDGQWGKPGDFALTGQASLGFVGTSFLVGSFALEGTAETVFPKVIDQFGVFALEGTAELDFVWVPDLCPGAASAECGVDPAFVTDLLYPASACLCNRKDC